MTTGKRRKREYAEWLPELDLHVGSRWERGDMVTSYEDVPVIARATAGAEEQVLDESA